jgi:Dihydrodipicolinate synthase/N-acetylneuraminate lyase
LVTPLGAGEKLDEPALARVVDHVIEGGVDAIFSMGTTGEFARFTAGERAHIAEATVQAAKGRVPVLVGASDAGTRLVVENARLAEEAGADAIVVSLPYYFPVKDGREIVDFYARVAAATRLPLVLYNIPATCGAAIDIESFKAIIALEGIVGIKDSSGSMDCLRAFLAAAAASGKKPFPVYVGEERIAAEGLAAGASGLVPSLANAFPKLFADLYAAASSGDSAKASSLAKRIAGMNALNLYSGSWLSAVAWRKVALAMMGICGEGMTAPYVPVDEATRASIARIVAERG